MTTGSAGSYRLIHPAAGWAGLARSRLRTAFRPSGEPSVTSLPGQKLAFVHEVVQSAAAGGTFCLHVDRDAQALGAAGAIVYANRARRVRTAS